MAIVPDRYRASPLLQNVLLDIAGPGERTTEVQMRVPEKVQN